MSSTFWGLYIGNSGLSTFQSAINTTANNVANVQTEGYSKQQVKIEQAASLRTGTRYGTLGTGVNATSIEQLRNTYYDMKYWNNTSSLNEYSTKNYYLKQIEDYFTDTEEVSGFSTIFSKMYNALESLKTSASEITARQAYVGTARSLATYFSNTASSLQDLQSEINSVVYTQVETINTLAQKIASVTKQINIVEQSGSNANDLRDERALLVDSLSEIVPVEVTELTTSEAAHSTSYKVKIAGQTLVDSYECNQLVCVARDSDSKVNQSDADGLYDIYWADSKGNPVNDKFNPTGSAMTGTLKGLFEIRDGNNEEAFTGTITGYTENAGSGAGKLTLTSTVGELALSINKAGVLSIGSRDISYSDFTLTESVNASTGETEYIYTFDIDESANKESIVEELNSGNLIGKEAEVGESIDYMGIPYYQSQLNQFARTYAYEYNAIQLKGKDMNGNAPVNFWVADGAKDSSYYYITASSLKVNDEVVSDPGKAVTSAYNETEDEASELTNELYALCTQTKLFRNTTADSFLQVIISDISVDAQSAETFESSYTNLGNSITQQRTSVSGVDQDEEALDLVKYQNAYNLSSKLIQVLSEMYDRLITETGV